MSFENPQLNKIGKNEQKNIPDEFMVLTGVDQNGSFRYEPLEKPLPEQYLGIPNELWEAIDKDLNALPENISKLPLNEGEYLKARISSNDEALYQILEIKRGHYLLAKIPYDLPTDYRDYRLEVLLARDLRNIPNPDFVVCTPEELNEWMRKA